MTGFQSEQLDYKRSGDRTCEPKHRSTLTIPLHHRSLDFNNMSYSYNSGLSILLVLLGTIIRLFKLGLITYTHQTTSYWYDLHQIWKWSKKWFKKIYRASYFEIYFFKEKDRSLMICNVNKYL